jgi:hypothetical protein
MLAIRAKTVLRETEGQETIFRPKNLFRLVCLTVFPVGKAPQVLEKFSFPAG